jgi:hypothetical protein
MISIPSYQKLLPFGVRLYGIPPLIFLILLVVSNWNSYSNSVQFSLATGISFSLFIISTVLGVVVDNYFRSAPEASFPKILIAGSFAWSFLLSLSMLFVGYMAFKNYDTIHHTRYMPQDIYSSWSTLIGHLFQGALLGGIFILPLNSLFIFLVRRRYRNQVSDTSHG